MKRKLMRIISFILAVLMLSTVTACKNGNDTSVPSEETLGVEILDGSEVSQGGTTSGEDKTGENVTSGDKIIDQSSKGAKVVNNCYVTGYPVAKKKVDINIMMFDDLNGADPHKRALAQFINQKFNVELKFQTIQVAQVSEKVTLAFASGQTPDIFWGMGHLGDISALSSYVKAGKIYSYDDYKSYAPNIYKMFAEHKDAQYLCTSEDGKIYSVPLYREDTDLYTDLFYINKTWLKKLGLKMPKTIGDLTNVLRKFKNDDPNGNGKQDEIPMVFVDEMPVSWYGFFGMSTYDYTTRTKDNKIKMAYTTNEFKNAISVLSDYYAEGLLYNYEMRNMNATKAKSLMDASVKTVGVISGVFNGGYSGLMSAETYLNHYSLMPIIDATGKGEQVPAYMDREMVWPCWGIIPKSCKYPEIAVRLMDYFYSLEGSAVGNYGPYGKNTYWNYNSKGQPVLNNNGTSPRDFWLGHAIPRYISTELQSKNFFKNDAKSNNQNTAKANALFNTEFESIYGKLKPRLTYNEKKKLNDSVSSNLTNVRVEWMYDFIYGVKNINSEWSTYINEVSRLGATAAQEVQQAADTRMQNWLKKNK